MEQISDETKVELLKYQILHNGDYDLSLYNLVSRNYLVKEISLIDDKTFYFDVEPEDGKISAKQFLTNMEQFVRYMKIYFFNVFRLSSVLNDIVESNHLELSNLLKYHCSSLGSFFSKDIDPTMEELLCKLIIRNFISNAKYIDSIKDVLEEVGVAVKNVADYSLNESKKILNLMSDIVFCQRGRRYVGWFFQDIDFEVNRCLDFIPESRKRKSDEEYKTKRIESFSESYSKIFKSYQVRKKYIKHFL